MDTGAIVTVGVFICGFLINFGALVANSRNAEKAHAALQIEIVAMKDDIRLIQSILMKG